MALEEELAKLTFPTATVNLRGSKLRLDIALSIRVSWLAELGPKATADKLWAHALLTRAS